MDINEIDDGTVSDVVHIGLAVVGNFDGNIPKQGVSAKIYLGNCFVFVASLAANDNAVAIADAACDEAAR